MSRSDRRHPLQTAPVWIIVVCGAALTLAWRLHWLPFHTARSDRPRATDLDPNLPGPPTDDESAEFAEADPENDRELAKSIRSKPRAKKNDPVLEVEQSEPANEEESEHISPASFSPSEREETTPSTKPRKLRTPVEDSVELPARPMSKRQLPSEIFRDEAVQAPESTAQTWPQDSEDEPIKAVAGKRMAEAERRAPRASTEPSPFGRPTGDFEASPDSRRGRSEPRDTDDDRGIKQAAMEGSQDWTNRVSPAGGQGRKSAARTDQNRETTSREAAKETNTELDLNEIKRLIATEEKDNEIEAHIALSTHYWIHPEQRAQLLTILEPLSDRIYFHKTPHFYDPYVVQPGENLQAIAKKYEVSWQYLAKLNDTEPKRLRAAQKLKVNQGPFAALVELSRFELTVHCQGHFVARYPIGIGKDNKTPIGKFKVLDKLEDPTYYGPDGVVAHDDPKNPLGERWIDLGNSIGIHGTIDPDSIGKAQSRGCVRLINEDVEDLYDLLTVGSEVVIRK